MSDEGEKTCPLCAEEMDLTDQQLKPCKCGYEICVWCWNHIMEMAEKDETGGRCPACRTPYDKKKIVGTAAKCERLVAEINLEKKKSQKAKTRTAEGRKQLSNVRVIKRNLVYIVGLPLNLADEDLLLRKEYFGQYGKVLKVSLSRTSAGTVQQFPNNTCSVYITYSKEEEAVRCIQSIHGFTLEDRPLRACFGTTKYCHAWMRNMPCTIPDCLYLHEIGSEEDSFTKDEIVSAHSRVQQITGTAGNVQRRSGNVLPPPVDDYCSNSSATAGKPVLKSTSNNLLSSAKVSPATSSAGKGGALPPAASWGTRDRASNCLSLAGSLVCLNGPARQKCDAGGAHSAFSAAVSGTSQISVQSNDLGKKVSLNGDSYPKDRKSKPKHPESVKQHGADLQTELVKCSIVTSVADTAYSATVRQLPEPLALDNDGITHPVKEQSCSAGSDRDRAFAKEGKSLEICPEVAITSIDKQMSAQDSMVGLSLDWLLDHRDQDLEHGKAVKLQEELASRGTSVYGAVSSTSDKQSALSLSSGEKEDFDTRRLSDVMATQTSLPSSILSPNLLSHLRSQSQCSDAASALNHNTNPIVNKRDEAATVSIPVVASDGLVDNDVHCTSGAYDSYVLPDGLHQKQTGRSDNEPVGDGSRPCMDAIESSIVSNILSLELDPWDDFLTSPHDLVNLLGENERRQGSSSRRAQNSGQSRFSFARQDEPPSQFLNVEPKYSIEGSIPHLFSPSLVEKGEPYLDGMKNGFGVSHHNADQCDGSRSNQSVSSTNKSSVSRSQISAPPGFSTPSRLPPPGFSSYGRNDQNFEHSSVFSSYGPNDRKFEQPPGFSSYERSDQNFEQMPVFSSYGPNDQKFKQPPGFSSYGRSDQSFEQRPSFSSYGRTNLTFDMNSGSHFLETSINSYHPPGSTSPTSVPDIEFIDPAILAVGRGRSPTSFSNSNIDLNSTFPTQTSALESNSQLHLLMQKPHSPRQSLRHTDIRDNYCNDAYELGSGHKGPTQIGSLSSLSQFALQSKSGVSNGQWGAWPEAMAGSGMGMAELLQNDRLGFNKLYAGYEPSKFHMPGSGDLYNRTFGM